MAKGMFTQGISILLDRPVSLDEIEPLLASHKILGRREARDSWEMGGPTLMLGYRPDGNGLIVVDTVDHPWPDHMGNKDEHILFGAWSMGHFGPYTFPGSLERAAQQCWTWDAGSSMPDRHRGFLRVRSSYAFGAKGEDPIMPADYDALPELDFVTRLALDLLDVKGALCYFNPNGEVLRDRDGLREGLEFGETNHLPPLDIWTNIRLFNVNAEWSLMDTVGNGQLDIHDNEACFHSESYDFNEIHNFLLNISLYILRSGEVVKDGDTMDGPGGVRWQAREYEESLCPPPRRVLRWLPMDDRAVPAEIADADE